MAVKGSFVSQDNDAAVSGSRFLRPGYQASHWKDEVTKRRSLCVPASRCNALLVYPALGQLEIYSVLGWPRTSERFGGRHGLSRRSSYASVPRVRHRRVAHFRSCGRSGPSPAPSRIAHLGRIACSVRSGGASLVLPTEWGSLESGVPVTGTLWVSVTRRMHRERHPALGQPVSRRGLSPYAVSVVLPPCIRR